MKLINKITISLLGLEVKSTPLFTTRAVYILIVGQIFATQLPVGAKLN